MKKITVLLSIFMIFIMTIPAFAAPATSGECGENIKWHYDSPTATLTISGTGDMPDYTLYTDDEAPWHRFESSIFSVVIKEGITSIGDYSFRFYDLLANVSIASSVKEIGSNAFSHCKALCEIDIPKGVETIGMEAFESCENLQKVSFPNTLKTIGDSAFCYCHRLKEINLPSSIKKIERLAFAHCAGLTSIEFPDGMERIGESCFYNCMNLEAVTFPNSIIRINEGAFRDCKKITKVIYEGTEKQWNEIKFKDNNENIQYANIEYKGMNTKGIVIAFVALLVVALTIFICKKKKYKYLIPIFIVLIVALLVSTFNGITSNDKDVGSDEETMLSGMYHQELGVNSYESTRGYLFKENGEYCRLNNENFNYFENWSKDNNTGTYTLEKSDDAEYDYFLKLNDNVQAKTIKFYIKTDNIEDEMYLYEYTPDAEFTILAYGRYVSEKYCQENGYTEFIWE